MTVIMIMMMMIIVSDLKWADSAQRKLRKPHEYDVRKGSFLIRIPSLRRFIKIDKRREHEVNRQKACLRTVGKESDKKLVDCINGASEQRGAPANHLNYTSNKR